MALLFFFLCLRRSSALEAAPLSVRAQIVSPPEGAVVALHYVRVFVNIHTPNPAEFTTTYSNASVCLSLDKAPYACWSVIDMEYSPMFIDVRDGAHELEAVVTKADDPWRLERRTWSGVRHFTVQTSMATTTTEETKPSEPVSPPQSPREISVPVIKIINPLELATVGAIEVAYAIESREPEAFKELFHHICFELQSSVLPCWSIFRPGGRGPFFSGISSSYRSITAVLAHPDSLSPIAETRTQPRPFFVEEIVEDESDRDEWRRYWSPVSSKEFFHNVNLNESRWEPPLGFPAPQNDRCHPFATVNVNNKPLRFPKGTNATLAAKKICHRFAPDDAFCVTAFIDKIVLSVSQAEEELSLRRDCREPLTLFSGGSSQEDDIIIAPPPPEDEDEEDFYSQDNRTAEVAVSSSPSSSSDDFHMEALVIPSSSSRNTPAQRAVYERLADLKQAFDAGLITKQEFDATRSRVLAST